MIKVGIIGGTGYTGVVLPRLPARHPQVELKIITSRGNDQPHMPGSTVNGIDAAP